MAGASTRNNNLSQAQKNQESKQRHALSQRNYRERMEREGVPERADIATSALNAFINAILADPRGWQDFGRSIVADLAARGFSRSPSAKRLKEIVLKAAAGKQKNL
jgi:hypothetical protein